MWERRVIKQIEEKNKNGTPTLGDSLSKLLPTSVWASSLSMASMIASISGSLRLDGLAGLEGGLGGKAGGFAGLSGGLLEGLSAGLLDVEGLSLGLELWRCGGGGLLADVFFGSRSRTGARCFGWRAEIVITVLLPVILTHV